MASTIKVDKIEGSTGSTITVPTGQTFTITDGIGVASGGTGLSSFTAGDVLYASGATTLVKLAKGTAEQILSMNSGATAPEWATAAPTAGGTGQTTWTQGDLLYANGANTLTKLAKGSGSDTLKMNSGATAPEWVTVAPATSDFVKIQEYTATSGATVDIDGDFSATYDVYRLIIRDWQMNSSWDAYMRMMVGGSVDTGTYYTISCFRNYTDSTPSNSITAFGDWDATDHWIISRGDAGSSTASEGCVFGWIDIYKPLNTSQWKYINYQYNHQSVSGTYQGQWGNCAYKNTNAISGIRLYSNITTVSNFEATLYGFKS